MLALVERVCLRCHFEGGNVPYEFRDGAMLRRVSATAAEALRQRTMPPWLPTQDAEEFLDAPMLTESERAAMIQWFELEAEGSEAWRAPAAARVRGGGIDNANDDDASFTLRFGEGWQTPAEPDLLFARTFIDRAPSGFPRRIDALRYRPLVAGSIESVMFNSDATGMGRELDARDGAIGAAFHADLGAVPAGALGAAGVLPEMHLPAGFAIAIEPGHDILAEAHARALGRSVSGAFEVTFTRAAEEDTRLVQAYAVGPASTGGAARRVGTTIEYLCDTLDAPMDIVSILPNTGMRCTSYDLNIVRRDGRVEGVVNIPVYRAWADRPYIRKTPLRVNPGDRFTLRVSHADPFAFAHTHASAVMLVAPSVEAITEPEREVVCLAQSPKEPVEMIAVPAGRVMVTTLHGEIGVDVRGFRIARTETTLGEFVRALARAPRPLDDFDTRDTRVPEGAADGSAPLDAALGVEADAPVVGIAYYDAVEYCNALSRASGWPPFYDLADVQRREDGSISSAVVRALGGNGFRLPTEVEWELAAADRGSADTWCAASAQPPSAARGAAQGTPNARGLLNMAGNVWEWCDDGYTITRVAPDADTLRVAPTNRGRVVKGGSFADSTVACTPSYHAGVMPSTRSALFGMRAVRSTP